MNHASEIAFALGTAFLDRSSTGNAKIASAMIMNYWLGFASSLEPNDGHGVVFSE